MKKIIALLLALLCIVSVMSGCSALEDFAEGFKDGVKEEISTPVDDDTKNKNDDETSTPTVDDKEEEKEFAFGVTNGKQYKSDFIGISCTIPEDWDFFDEEAIKELNDIALDAMDDDIAEKLKNANVIYDMYASNASTADNVNINLEKIPSYMASNLNVEEVLKKQFTAIEQSLESAGASVNEIKYIEIEVDGQKIDGVFITSTVSGTKLYQKMIAFDRGNYLVYITATSFDANGADEILSFFNFD